MTLFQEAQYQEQTAGDLDKAIELYQKVVTDAAEMEKLAARATFQLGMCYLKKGDKDKAANYFSKVVSGYPQQTNLVKNAQQQLEKLGKVQTAAEAGKITEIAYDDGKSAGRESIAGSGHSVRFENPGDGCFLKAVRIYGSRYGTDQPPQEDFHIYICDENFKAIADFAFPYSRFQKGDRNGDPKGWVSLNIDRAQTPAELPSKFFICADFKPERTKGVYVHHDAANSGNSYVALPGQELKPFDRGDWMIRAVVEQSTQNPAKQDSIKPLKLGPAPWADGEVMELRLKKPAGNEYGTIIYSARSNILDGKDTWQIVSHLYVTEGSVSQYTFVEAQAESFAPIYGQTTSWMGNFVAEYNEGNVKLTTGSNDKKNTRDIPVGGVVYDNEQAVYLIRRMPLAENYEGSFLIFTVQGGATVECRIKVLGVEDITVAAGTFKCFKTDLSIYADSVKSLQHTLWFSADEHKYLVKYDVAGAGTMELAKVWQKDKKTPMVFENAEPAFSVAVPADWRFYSYELPGPQYLLQMLPPDVKAWALLARQKHGDDPNSASATTIAKADSEKLKGFFKNYLIRPDSSKDITINGCQASQYIADYQQSGNGLQTYDKPKDMVEYRTYIVDKAEVYWFVFRIEKDKFEENKPEFDSIVNSFKINANQ
jgi:RNA polymerase sigma-70 factor (ECF subfamily)